MHYAEFRDKVKRYPLFRSNIFEHLTKKPAALRRQVSEWIAKNYVLPLKRGVYTLRKDDRSAGLSLYFLANNLYSPSYISLETALSYYGLIPERVEVITSISSKKTQTFKNSLGMFSYHHIKPELYGDFISEKDEFNNQFFIATPERAINDFFYLKMKEITSLNSDIFEGSFRFQHLNFINKTKLRTIAKKFAHPKLMALVNLLIQHIENNHE